MSSERETVTYGLNPVNNSMIIRLMAIMKAIDASISPSLLNWMEIQG
ncbi:hypothetical protein ACSU1N_05400 [Thermogladius sp. 4427co]